MAVVPGATESGAQTSALVAESAATTSVNTAAASADTSAPDATASTIAATTVSPNTTATVATTAAPTTTAAAPPIFSATDDILAWPVPIPLTVGVNEQQVPIGGFSRSYLAVVPPPMAKPRSLLIVLRGVNGRGANMRALGFEPSAALN